MTKVGNVKSRGLSLKKKKKKLCKIPFDSRNVLYYTVNQYACHKIHLIILMVARPWFENMWNILIFFFFTSVAPTFPSFYQLLIKSERRRGNFHKYANTRSHHHLCLMSFSIHEPPRGYSRAESVVCVAHSPVFPVLCTLHPPCNLQSVSVEYFTHIWYLDLLARCGPF